MRGRTPRASRGGADRPLVVGLVGVELGGPPPARPPPSRDPWAPRPGAAGGTARRGGSPPRAWRRAAGPWPRRSGAAWCLACRGRRGSAPCPRPPFSGQGRRVDRGARPVEHPLSPERVEDREVERGPHAPPPASPAGGASTSCRSRRSRAAGTPKGSPSEASRGRPPGRRGRSRGAARPSGEAAASAGAAPRASRAARRGLPSWAYDDAGLRRVLLDALRP